jgi:hypothetical protein
VSERLTTYRPLDAMRLDDGRVLVDEGRARVRHYVALEDVTKALRRYAALDDDTLALWPPGEWLEREAREGRL